MKLEGNISGHGRRRYGFARRAVAGSPFLHDVLELTLAPTEIGFTVRQGQSFPGGSEARIPDFLRGGGEMGGPHPRL